MIYITDRAMVALRTMREDAEASEDESILLFLEEDGSLGLALAEIEEGDNVIEHEGEIIVIVAEDLAEALDGTALDAVVSDDGEEIEFIIIEPDQFEPAELDDNDLENLNGDGQAQ